MISWMAPFPMTLNDLRPRFKGHAVTLHVLFDVEYLRNRTRYRHSYNDVRVGTYTRRTYIRRKFKWLSVILCDSKFSTTLSIASHGLFATAELLFIAARCYASAAYAVMQCPSVRPSVTFVDSVKMNKHIFNNFSPSRSHTVIVFPY